MTTSHKKLVFYLGGPVMVVITFFPYFLGTAWKFFLAAALLLCFLKITSAPGTWLKRGGLAIPSSQLKWVVLLGLIIFCLSKLYLDFYLPRAGIVYYSFKNPWWRASPWFQCLNEEIVFRALLLSALFKKFPYRFTVSVTAALVFTGLHWFLYAFNEVAAVQLTPLTLFNLFFFGMVCNAFYLRYQHIGFGFALHAGWNLTRFTRYYYSGLKPSAPAISEGMSFNLIEGSWFLSALILMVYLFISALRLDRSSLNPVTEDVPILGGHPGK
jgi:membrane protease YdiL (CAAX protease family)